MKALADELITILTKQTALYDDVRTLMEDEREALTSKKPDEVMALVRRKETILLQIKTLDESRRLICARLASEWRMPVSSLTLGEIAQRIKGPVSHELGAMRLHLAACLDKLRLSNEKSARVCQNGVEVIRRIVQQAAESNAQSAGYSPGAVKASPNGVTTRVQRAYGGIR